MRRRSSRAVRLTKHLLPLRPARVAPPRLAIITTNHYPSYFLGSPLTLSCTAAHPPRVVFNSPPDCRHRRRHGPRQPQGTIAPRAERKRDAGAETFPFRGSPSHDARQPPACAAPAPVPAIGTRILPATPRPTPSKVCPYAQQRYWHTPFSRRWPCVPCLSSRTRALAPRRTTGGPYGFVLQRRLSSPLAVSVCPPLSRFAAGKSFLATLLHSSHLRDTRRPHTHYAFLCCVSAPHIALPWCCRFRRWLSKTTTTPPHNFTRPAAQTPNYTSASSNR